MSKPYTPAEQRLDTALTRIHASPWAMLNQSLVQVMERITVAVIVEEEEPAEPIIITQVPSVNEARVPRLPKVGGRIGVIPVRGVIGQHRCSDYWADVYTEVIEQQVTALVSNPTIGAVILDIDSPGWIVYGTPELSATLRAAREAKPIYAVATGMAASAGYWMGASATKFFAAPSREVGSIGVWSAQTDWSKALEDMGIKTTLISAGEFKVEGNPFEPLGDAAKADMQASVDRYHEMFKADVATGRGVSVQTVASDFGKGRLVGADAAKAAGMIDGIATLGEVLAGIMKPAGNRQASAAAALALEEASG